MNIGEKWLYQDRTFHYITILRYSHFLGESGGGGGVRGGEEPLSESSRRKCKNDCTAFLPT